MPGIAKPNHVRRNADEAAPLLLPHRWQEIFHAQKVRVQVRCHRLSPRRQIQVIDSAIRKIAGIIHNNVHVAEILSLAGYGAPIFFSRHIKLKRERLGTNLARGFVRRLEVGCNYSLCPALRRPTRLANTLAGPVIKATRPSCVLIGVFISLPQPSRAVFRADVPQRRSSIVFACTAPPRIRDGSARSWPGDL